MTGPVATLGNGGHDHTLLDVLERMRNRFFGKYRGVVIDLDAKTMRIKAIVPAVLGATISGWARGCVPYAGANVGFAFLPEMGSGVWIEFEGGDVSLPIWSGCYWRDSEPPPDAADGVKVIVTSAGQKIMLDSDGGTITIEDANGNSLVMDSSGVTLKGQGQSVALGASGVNLNDGAFQVT